MKIISSYKDYYDYLTGIYGVDPILVLDRTKHKQPYDIGIEMEPYTFPRQHSISHNALWIGNYYVEFMTYDGIPYFGEDVKNIPGVKTKDSDEIKFHWWASTYERKYNKSMSELNSAGLIDVSWGERRITTTTILLTPIKTKRPPYLKDDVIIGLGGFDRKDGYGDYEYPILSKLGLNKFVPAETVYQWIIEYLSEQKLKAEQTVDNRTNIQKIEGKGFDKVTSFRPNIK